MVFQSNLLTIESFGGTPEIKEITKSTKFMDSRDIIVISSIEMSASESQKCQKGTVTKRLM